MVSVRKWWSVNCGVRTAIRLGTLPEILFIDVRGDLHEVSWEVLISRRDRRSKKGNTVRLVTSILYEYYRVFFSELQRLECSGRSWGRSVGA